MCPIITKETYESLHTYMQFHVKLQQQWIKSVQMKAKTVRRETNHCLESLHFIRAVNALRMDQFTIYGIIPFVHGSLIFTSNCTLNKNVL